jgi:hypothetical protein
VPTCTASAAGRHVPAADDPEPSTFIYGSRTGHVALGRSAAKPRAPTRRGKQKATTPDKIKCLPEIKKTHHGRSILFRSTIVIQYMACCDLPSAEGWQSIRTPFDLLLGVLTRTTSKEQYETSRTATDFATLKFCACPWRFSGRSPSARPWWIYCRSNVVTAISGHSSKKKPYQDSHNCTCSI